jgi:hypothetical protein
MASTLLILADTHVPTRARRLPDQPWERVNDRGALTATSGGGPLSSSRVFARAWCTRPARRRDGSDGAAPGAPTSTY